ncbi:hypothetical protein E3P86_02338 [Wallemia ichthyophaga]|uniref:Translation elongation factor EFTs/EF1B dimerisation domain-containing protein n=1 Tax=Wallemia ichthyophaga TaxID=245174 RepID=A0A4T0J2V7_WALIC|nr:hypothetical protein E3P86_02338 [Wallemia ichthyophaga]
MPSRLELIKQLRSKFNCSINQAVASLNQSGNDLSTAETALKSILNSDNASKINKAVGKGEGSEGLIGSVVLHNGFPVTGGAPALNRARGGLLELSCQSDFVGRTNEFKRLVEDVTHSLSFLVDADGFTDVDVNGWLDAPLISSSPTSTPSTPSTESIHQAITKTIASVGENITIKRFTAFNLPSAKSANANIRSLGQFTHSIQPNSHFNEKSPVQLGLLAALVDLEVSGGVKEENVHQMSRKIARQSVAMPCLSVDELLEQELLGGVNEESIILVAILWVCSYELTDEMFRLGYNKPFFLTYLTSSSFSPYLIPYVLNRKSTRNPVMLTPNQTFQLAVKFTLFWTLANFSINASLQFTSVASSTILSSTSGLWTFLIGVLLRVESFEFTKLFAIFASISGSFLVTFSDFSGMRGEPEKFGGMSILGDTLALLSAISFSVYMLLLKKTAGSESRIDFPLFLGCIGAISTVCLWPLLVILDYTQVEPFHLPETTALGSIILLNMAISFSSDYLYLQAMLKTSPLVATIGISLCLPFSIVADWWRGQLHLTTCGLVGSALVLASFVVLGYEEDEEEQLHGHGHVSDESQSLLGADATTYDSTT